MNPNRSPGIQRGFTLVELLVVMVAIGVLVSAATLAVGLSDNRRFYSDTQRLQIVLQQAAEAALLQQRELGWQLERGQYRIVQLAEEGRWKDSSQRLFQSHALPAEQSLQLKSDHSGVDANQPKIVFYSSGEYSPFQLSLQQGDQILTISGDGLGDIQLHAERESGS